MERAYSSWVYIMKVTLVSFFYYTWLILGGPWDLLLLITGIIALLITEVTPLSPFRVIIGRVTSPVMTSY